MTPALSPETCNGSGPHGFGCYAREKHVCPSCCAALVSQPRLQCTQDISPLSECIPCSLACPDCPSEVRITERSEIRARVIHSATCPWYRRYLAREVTGRIPCGATVTHRGPYKRDPQARCITEGQPS